MQNGAFLGPKAVNVPQKFVLDLGVLRPNPNAVTQVEKGTHQWLKSVLHRGLTSRSQYLLLEVEGQKFLHHHLF